MVFLIINARGIVINRVFASEGARKEQLRTNERGGGGGTRQEEKESK